MTLHFGREKFKSFLVAGTFITCVGFLNCLADSVIVGHLIGEDAFAGINMVAPIQACVLFFGYMIAVGTATNYLIWMGRMDRYRARRFFMQGLWMAVLVGGCLSAATYFGEGGYFLSLNGSEYVEMYGRQYMDWIWPVGILACVGLLLMVFCCADGDIRLASLASGVIFVLNVAISYVAVERGMGASGCALGTIVAYAIGILFLCTHFFRKVNTFAPVGRVSLSDAYYILRAGFGDAANFLCSAILFFWLNKLVIWRFDSDCLPVASAAILVWRFLQMFGGIGMAAQPIVSVYWGERNTRGIRKVMQFATFAAVAEGALLSGLFLAFPSAVVALTGVEYPDLVLPVRQCVMLTCAAFVPLAVASLFNSYFLFIERPLVSLGATVICCLAAPVACSTVGAHWGMNGIWTGLGLGPYLGLLLIGCAILVKRGRRGFPFLLPRGREEKTLMFDLALVPDEIVRVSKEVAAALPPDLAPRAALLVEEVFMAVRERNADGRRILGEVTLDLNDGVLMTLRDDGVVFDITDADAQVSSLRTYLVASVMRSQMGRINLLTSGFNRNVFRLA